MAKKFLKSAFLTLIALTMIFSLYVSASAHQNAAVPCYSGVTGLKFYSSNGVGRGNIPTANLKDLKVYVGGMPFGVKFLTDGVIVAGTFDVKTASGVKNPATDAGLKANDVILEVNGVKITDSALLSELCDKSGGAALKVVYQRGGKRQECTLTPAKSAEDGKYKSGIYARDSGAGIGTVTYILPETLEFGGLGHGICDGESGKLIPMQRGSVVGVTINGVVKGLVGDPGEVRGYFSSGKTGTLLTNTECGVFGAFAKLPDSASTLMNVGSRNEIKTGEAYILSTLDGTTPQKYRVEISDIHLGATGNKCFTVKVTDPALLEKSGGIVQGMSGSPIIQNGKLIGAVTHVLINDPATGYGIFIENMLSAANTPIKKAA